MKQVLNIKNMVCPRCVMVVEKELKTMGITANRVLLGSVELAKPLSDADLKKVRVQLEKFGFNLIDDKKQILVEKVKNELIILVHKSEPIVQKISVLLSEKLLHDYSYISHVFSEMEEQTIEQYYILLRMEKVKELLTYQELTLSEIAAALQFSSAAHLSNQFKKVVGVTPSVYKAGNQQRISLDKLTSYLKKW